MQRYRKLVVVAFAVAFGGVMAAQRVRTAETPVTEVRSDWVPSDGSKTLHVDFNADGLNDVFMIDPSGKGQLLIHLGDGRYEDRTVHAGLGDLGQLAMALSGDLNADGNEDLVLVTGGRRVQLLVGVGQAFADHSATLGLEIEGDLRSIALEDRDLNGWMDLVVVSEDGDGRSALAVAFNHGESRFEVRRGTRQIPSSVLAEESWSNGEDAAVTADDLVDQAGGSAIQASSVPTLGKLLPVGPKLFVDPVFDRVGVGTTAPARALDVDGVIRSRSGGFQFPDGTIQTTKTLQGPPGAPGPQGFQGAAGPTGPQGLSGATGPTGATGVVSFSGNNTRGGTNALASTTGSNNSGFGVDALRYSTSGNNNTAVGSSALRANTVGFRNTSIGTYALSSNTDGLTNTATGAFALRFNTAGDLNAATGAQALYSNTTGSNNVAIGALALYDNDTGNGNVAVGKDALANSSGDRNVAIGQQAGGMLTTGNDNIAIGNEGTAGEGATIRIGTAGTHARTFIAGIRGVATGQPDANSVMVDSNGQLGTIQSSRRYKEDIHDMGDATERLLELRPVLFRYKSRNAGGNGPLEYGLIAEEVAEVFPDLVVYDDEGRPETVKYHLLGSMLLNELKKEHERVRAYAGRTEDLEADVAALKLELARLALDRSG